MVKIVRYEVYAQEGNNWQLIDQFAGDDRHEAVSCAKEVEAGGKPVKIIREIYDTSDNSFQESVEYIGGLKKTLNKKQNNFFEDLHGDYNVEATPFKELAENQFSKAILKLVLIITFSLLLANILVSLSVPLVEFLAPEEQRKGILFFGFLLIFVLIAVPLLLYKIPWNIFYSVRKGDKEVINERRFFHKAVSLMNNYNLNDDGKEVIVPVYPEAPLEYKQYIVDYLSQILNNLDSSINPQDSFNKLGIKLVVYGGCLELSRFGRLLWAEANSLLYEAFSVLDGDDVDLQAFYDAKRSYSDNKVAVFLTGVGGYLMSQVIRDIPMDASILKSTMDKWIAFNTRPQTPVSVAAAVFEDENETKDNDAVLECLANIRMSIQFFDDEKELSDEEQNTVKADIHNIIAEQLSRLGGSDVVEDKDITSVRFGKPVSAVKFILNFQDKLEAYKDAHAKEYNLMTDVKSAVLEVPSNQEVNLSHYISNILEYAYNQEIIVNSVIKDELLDSVYKFEFLGDKTLRDDGEVVSLYKLNVK